MTTIRKIFYTSLFIAILAISFFCAFAQNMEDPLAQGFKNPPDSAKPRTWWHWTGSNVTKEGITKDFEWMKRIGLGGMQMFDVGTGGGQPVEKKTVFMTPEWLEALKHAASEADRLGLEMTMAASGGWSETGGPWVKPEQAMKKVVWSEMTVEGPKNLIWKLPQPPFVNGQIRDLPLRGLGEPVEQPQSADPTYYEDTKVLAYLTPKDSVRMEDLNPRVTSSAGIIDASALVDDSLITSVSLPIPDKGKPAWIQYEFAQPFKARAVSFAISASGIFGSSVPIGAIEASDDGKTFRTLARLPGEEHNIRPINVRTFAFPETSAPFYRLELTHPSLGMRGFGDAGPGFVTIVPQKQYTILEFKFYSDGRVNRWEDKASFAPLFEFDTLTTPKQPPSAVIERGREIDLSSMMSKDGTLNWTVPAGKWTILRMGYSLTGAKNNPSTPASQGFEVDKLNPRYVEAYFHGYTDRISQTLGPLFGKSLRYLLMDSWEANSQNWTNDMIAEFHKRRGYDPTSYLPVLSGRVVESAEISDRFLWDYRRTVADMLAENHYGKISELLHQCGMGLYAEAVGVSLPILEDTLLVKKHVDIPMGEFGLMGSDWVPPVPAVPYMGQDNRQNDYWADIRGAASAAHIYGKPFVGAESFTGGGYEAPGLLKWVADYWTSQGVNRFIFHTSAHQPLDTKPGNTMVGTHFNRNITWAELALPFTTYLARNMYMTQQGVFVADIAYYLGEGIPSSPPYWEKLKPEAPKGYDYDFLNTDMLLNGLSVKEGRLLLPSGMSYSLLALPESREMTLPALRKLRELVAAGAIVVGPKPIKSPSLAGHPQVDKEVASLADELWGETDGRTIWERSYGKGRVFWGLPLADVLAVLGVPPDFECTRPESDVLLLSIHRRAGDADIYFITNQKNRAENVSVCLRVDNKEAELWRADTGAIELVEYSIAGGRTTVPLRLEARESVFIVLRKQTLSPSRDLPLETVTPLATLSGPWDMTFPPNLGAPPRLRLEKLASWTAQADDGVRYFSGTATYTKDVEAPQSWFLPGARIQLDLGEVLDIAQVSVNGEAPQILWKAPYKMDVTARLKPGANHLGIKVTNQWTNRILGDQALPADKKILAPPPATGMSMRGPSQPTESGLIGPVTFSSVAVK
jgi:hypothetical protein